MSSHTDVSGRSGDLPNTSTPNSSKDLYVNGELYQRRYYDASGNMIKDIDFLHNNTGAFKHTFPHDHYWTNSNGKWNRVDSLEEWLKIL